MKMTHIAWEFRKRTKSSEIADKTGASTATISRVNRSLNYGSDGYDMVFSRLQVDCGTGEPENKE
ncbi:YerC/YecD family TrpR-related protein [Enterocloster bolteae]|nr:YerC/YecD family TrpR-related protein [Hungatella hathewayi]